MLFEQMSPTPWEEDLNELIGPEGSTGLEGMVETDALGIPVGRDSQIEEAMNDFRGRTMGMIDAGKVDSPDED
jgi:hypothetical protein